MTTDQEISNLEELIDRLCDLHPENGRVPIGAMVEAAGTSSFGPLMVMTGLFAFSPASGIPGVPTFVALIVLVTAGQVVIGRQHVWLPGWIVRRSVSQEKLEKNLARIRPGARMLDRLFRPRLTILMHHVIVHIIAVVCVMIALAMPIMEIIPFAATTAGLALSIFGLALIARDGVMTLLALGFTLGSASLIIRGML